MFDRFDVCEANYVFAMDYHRGQSSSEYAIFGRLERLRFKPLWDIDRWKLTENGKRILTDLVAGQREGR